MRKIFMTLWALGVISCGEKKYHDQKLAPIAEVSDSLVKAAMKYQLNLDQSFMDAAETPLLEKDRVDFDVLDYFPINPAHCKRSIDPHPTNTAIYDAHHH